ncbi:MAG: hypothetical protein KBB14_15025, partial [Thermoanaerobaculia bacterium]|nr:hypothetical protein [Thermoanaerobaculia bacterium]
VVFGAFRARNGRARGKRKPAPLDDLRAIRIPRKTRYGLDAWIWKVKPENRAAAQAVGLAAQARPGAE